MSKVVPFLLQGLHFHGMQGLIQCRKVVLLFVLRSSREGHQLAQARLIRRICCMPQEVLRPFHHPQHKEDRRIQSFFCTSQAPRVYPSLKQFTGVQCAGTWQPANVTCSLFFRKQSERCMLVLSGARYCVTVRQTRSTSPREVAFALSVIHALVLIRRTDGRP